MYAPLHQLQIFDSQNEINSNQKFAYDYKRKMAYVLPLILNLSLFNKITKLHIPVDDTEFVETTSKLGLNIYLTCQQCQIVQIWMFLTWGFLDYLSVTTPRSSHHDWWVDSCRGKIFHWISTKSLNRVFLCLQNCMLKSFGWIDYN